jgi:hypothetical protein
MNGFYLGNYAIPRCQRRLSALRRCRALKVWSRGGWVCPDCETRGTAPRRERSS